MAADRQRAVPGSGDTIIDDKLLSVEAREDLVAKLEEEFDRELLEEAMLRVRLRVEARTWDAFRLLALEQKAGAEAAAQLHMKVAAVFVAKSKVQKMIRHEIQKLEPN